MTDPTVDAAPQGGRLKQAGLRILHVSGDAQAEGPGKVLVLSRGDAVVGRDPGCDLCLVDREVSARHAVVSFDGDVVRLRDAGSRNGSFVNGVAVVDARLAPGDVVRLGSTLLVVEGLVDDPAPESFGRYSSRSPRMRSVFQRAARLAKTEVPVVITGETGTGKEVMARALHEESRRREGPFVVFDCTTVAPTLIEAALFGHEKGAFTGAVAAEEGVFEQAHGGTLLIDEIGDLDLPLQGRLLRAIERSEVRRVGGRRWVQVDVRIIAATRRDLPREVRELRFRDDLYYRLAVATLELPPLRDRREDIPALTHLFWREAGGLESELPPSLVTRLAHGTWPGNVRQLRNAVARALALGDLEGVLIEGAGATESELSGLDGYVEELVREGIPLRDARDKILAQFESRYLEAVMRAAGGNTARAAEILGVAERYVRLLRSKRLANEG
jgi:DNA-binding NtrC family response regulator